MTLYLIKVVPAVAERIRNEPDLLRQAWDEVEVSDPEIAAMDKDRDRLMEDYLHIGRQLADSPGRYPWLDRAVAGTGVVAGFDFGYSLAFFVTPEEVGEIAAGLVEEGSWRPGEPVMWIDHAVAAFYVAAHAEGKSIIGGIG